MKRTNMNKIKIMSIACTLLILFILTPLKSQDYNNKIHLSMEEAISRALSQNNQVWADKYALKKANWDKWHAWTLLLPRLDINSRYTRIDEQTFAERDFRRYLPPEVANQMPQTVFQESYYTSLDVSMPLFNPLVLNGLYIASANEDMAEHLDESTKHNIIFQVVSSYLNTLKSNDLFNLQKEYLSLSKLNYEKAERLHNAGRYSKSEVLRWKVEYQQQKSTVVSSESNLRSSKTILSRLINKKQDEKL